MKETTKTKINSGILITLGSAMSFISIKAMLDVLNIIINIFYTTPSIAWTGKQSMLIILLLISGAAITWLGIQFGAGSINIGVKKLKALRAKIRMNTMLNDMQIMKKPKEE